MPIDPGPTSRDRILVAATAIAQARGYGGLNLRALAEQVGIKAASLYHHFPSKAHLAAAVAQRYAQTSAETLAALQAEAGDAQACLRRYPDTFRRSLEHDNRICLCSFMAAEYDDLPAAVQDAVQVFADQNVAWLGQVLEQAGLAPAAAQLRARAIFAAVSGAQLMARGRADIGLFDALVDSYRDLGMFSA
ncbi:MAG TPA: TetR/AcrR family transcriptional regulator [Telluria sp.]|jgi:TetR/AcrR family transcriptional repressor of nem operon